jgi:hypothetical protein
MYRKYILVMLIGGFLWAGPVVSSHALFGLGDSDKKELIRGAVITLQQAVETGAWCTKSRLSMSAGRNAKC